MNALILCNMDVKRVMFVSRKTLGRQHQSSLIAGYNKTALEANGRVTETT